MKSIRSHYMHVDSFCRICGHGKIIQYHGKKICEFCKFEDFKTTPKLDWGILAKRIEKLSKGKGFIDNFFLPPFVGFELLKPEVMKELKSKLPVNIADRLQLEEFFGSFRIRFYL
jgi:hypothetical protein